MTNSTRIEMTSRPEGWPTLENFTVVEAELPPLAEGEVRVKNEFISLDPYMRGLMDDTDVDIDGPPYQLNQPLSGGAVGHVVESRHPDLPVGTAVQHDHGWRDIAQGPAEDFQQLNPTLPLSSYLGILGLTGMTAWSGLLSVGRFKEGDAVFVSGAAGAVGSVVGQIAKLKGASLVVGSAGSAEKVATLLDKYHFDRAFNYKDGPVGEQLKTAAPDGIDLYFDNVGGEHLTAAIDSLNLFGRITACGMSSIYNATEPQPGPDNLIMVIDKRLSINGLIAYDFYDRFAEFEKEMSDWIRDGKIHYDETIIDGIENAPQAFLDLLAGANTGKTVVRI
ncbi:MAG: NADP-dependent oxidoreductase [Renibacterium sp.]|nr:NADP-dependent oxidoreductase [Renibacterium sp.]